MSSSPPRSGSSERWSASREHVGRAFQGLPVAILAVDRRGIVVMANAQAATTFGYAAAELVGQHVERLVPERFRDKHPAFRESFFSDPHARPMGAGRELFALRKDGGEFPVEIGLNPIEGEGGETLVISAIVDLTQSKRLERRFQLVVESAPNAMVVIDRGGTIVMVNAQAERMFGYARAELVGGSVEVLVPERFRAQHPRFRQSFVDAPQARPMGAGRDLYALRKDGREFPVEIGLNPIETDEGTLILSAIVDISERKQREERIEAALREKELLLGEVHHRVKNNLQVVDSLLDLQGMRTEVESVRELLLGSRNRVRSMSLIHQTLYQSRDFGRVDFQQFLRSLVPALMEAYAASPDRIALEIDAGSVQLPIDTAIPCGLMVNELVTNALKYAFPGGACGRMWVKLAPVDEHAIQLSVGNDGVPISDALDLERTGTLGLELVHLLARQLRGHLSIRRADPTLFEIRFPLKDVP